MICQVSFFLSNWTNDIFVPLQDNVPYKPPEYGEGLEELDEVYVQVIRLLRSFISDIIINIHTYVMKTLNFDQI